MDFPIRFRGGRFRNDRPSAGQLDALAGDSGEGALPDYRPKTGGNFGRAATARNGRII